MARIISGKVTGEGVSGLTDTRVVAYAGGMWVGVGYTMNDWSGRYWTAVPGGTYTLWADEYTETFASGWYRSTGYTADPSAATAISVTSGNATGKDVRLPIAHTLRGRVTNSGDKPVQGVYVTAWLNDKVFNSAYTHPDGRYSIAVAPGSYKVAFYDGSGKHESGWYSGGGIGPDRSSATTVALSTTDIRVIDVVLTTFQKPTPPIGTTAVAHWQSASVSWSRPTSDGGSPIASYTVTSSPEGKSCTTTGSTSCVVTGLTNGTPYTFTVTATNAIGTSDPSDPSAPVTPVPTPDAPTSVVAVGLDGSARISWAAAEDNGYEVSAYTVTLQPGNKHCATTGELSCTLTGLANHSTYSVIVTATNSEGVSLPSDPPVSVTPRVGSSYVPLVPSRVMDSASGLGLTGALAPYVAATFAVTGLHPGDASLNVPDGASAVTGILSLSDATYKGWVSLTPEPNDHPTTSSINFPAHDARSTGITVPLGSGGKLSVTYGAPATTAGRANSVEVIFDVTGYFITGTSGSTYVSLTPNRLVDSRPTGSGHTNTGLGAALVAGAPATFAVTGRTPTNATTNVPSSAVAVTGTLTVTGQTAPGYFALGPNAVSSPGFTSLYFPKGDNRATGLTVKLGSGGKLSVTFASTTAGATSHVVFDVNGYFVPGTAGAMYVPVTPNRLVDSRIKQGISGALKDHVAATFGVVNRVASDPAKNVPTGAVAITGTLTVTNQTYMGWLSLTPTPNNNPTTSNLNFPKGDVRATGVTVPLSSAGKCSVTYGAKSRQTTHVVFDVTGYFVN